MRLNRFALVAGVLALGVAACGDDVQVVEPTPPVPPPPPAVTATMAPASASVAVGSNVVFAVTASGGVSGEAASWTCASSNTGIATVSVVSAGCQATGVAAGSVTITAAVSKSGETVNVGAQLTVTSDEGPPQPPGAPAFVVVASVVGDDDTDVGGLQGRVNVTLNVERGDQTLEMLSLLLDGAVVASQSFGGSAMTPPEDDAAEQAVHAFTMGFDSDGYAEDGTPDYMNGEHTIQAELQIAGGMMPDGMMGHETVSSNTVTVEFDNDDFIGVSIAGLGDGAMNEASGQIWHGGPGIMPEITAVPVSYSDGSIASLTLLSFCGADAATDSEAPFSFTVECDDHTSDEEDGDMPSFTIGGVPAKAKVSAVYLDFEGPDAPHFSPDPNMRQDGWVNPTVDFLGKQSSSRNPDGWLTYNDDATGVGGYMPQLRFSSTTPTVVDGARAATPNAIPTEATKENAVCVIATAVDLLGNESKLPSAGKKCADAAAYKEAVQALKDARDAKPLNADDVSEALGKIPAGIRAGLDVSAPTIAFSTASPKENATSLKNFQVQVADTGGSTGKSGLHEMPVLAKIEVRNAKDDIICGDHKDVGGPVGKDDLGECTLSANNIDFSNPPLATTKGLGGDPKMHGYYTFTAHTRDKAGNKSEELVRTAVNDNEDPQAGLIVGGYSKGAYTLTVTATDDLSIKSYWPEQKVPVASIDQTNASSHLAGITATNLKILPSEGVVTVDEYNGSLTQNHLETITMKSFRAVQNNAVLATAGDATTAPTTSVIDPGSMIVVAVDQAGTADSTEVDLTAASSPAIFGIRATGTGTDSNGNTTTTNSEIPVTGATNAGTVQPAPKYKRDQVFQTFSADETGTDDDTVELRAEIVGIAGYKAAVAGSDNDTPTDATDDTDAAPGEEGLVGNPVSRVDFYALVALKDESATDSDNRVPPVVIPSTTADAEALVLIASVSAAGAEDFTHRNGTTADTDAARADDYAARKYVWSADVSAAEVLAAIGSKERSESVQFIAVAVNSDGVAIIDAVSNPDASDALVPVTVAP